MFKKTMIAFTICFVLLISYGANNKPVFIDYADSYKVYRQSNSSNATISTANAFEVMIMSGKTGESCQVNPKDFNLRDFLKDFDAKICLCEKTENAVNYYAYSKKIPYQISLGEKKINLHVCISESIVTLGTPIIYGSF